MAASSTAKSATKKRKSVSRGKNATLDFSSSQFKAALRRSEKLVMDYLDSVNRKPIFPRLDGERLRRIIREPLPVSPRSPVRVLQEFERRVLPYVRHNLHPRFFGYVSSPGNPMGVVADLVTAAVNQNVTSWRSAPVATEVELQTIDWIKELVGYPAEALGMFTSGGSSANLQALAVAREIIANAEVSLHGVQSLGRQKLVLYMSTEGHMSIPKAMGLLGLGKSAVRTVRVDSSFGMDTNDLQQKIEEDRAHGLSPFCVVGNAGTVNTGAIDDLGEIGRIAAREKMWFHVDAAYGGYAMLVPQVKKRFRGLESADSVTLDPHKWLYQPIDAGCVLIRDRRHAHRTFSGSGDYAKVIAGLPGEDFAFFEHGMDLTRRFRALKIWMTFKCYGVRALRSNVEKNLKMAQYLRNRITSCEDIELLAPVELAIVCFRFIPKEFRERYARETPATQRALDDQLNGWNRELMTRMQRGGVAYVSNAVLNGKFALRACVLSYRTEEQDMDILVGEIQKLGRAIAREKKD
ncbi:MAG: pyridoxal-dependent decarboxylase [Acidobacteriia bacterium]|nr:pyridoxal-dependent decarboxylase [Terriglobia bacterium]